MKYEEIIKLLDAGYTREEILDMETKPAVPEEPKPVEPKPDEVSETLKEMRDMFSEMKKEFTAMNILSTQRTKESEKTGEEVIANIINPVIKKKGDK